MFSWGRSSYPGANQTSQPLNTRSTNVVGEKLTREKHIQSYVNHPTLGRSTRMVKNTEGTFDTVFRTRNENTLILRVHVSGAALLPLTKAPSMMLIGCRVSHPWINATNNKVVGYPVISSDADWDSSNMKLGDAVNNVVRHLQLNPPVVSEISDPNLLRMQPKPSSINTTNTTINNSGGPPPPAYESVQEEEKQEEEDPDADLPFDFSIPSSFPTLETMSLAEMQHLLDNREDFEEYAVILPSRTASLEFRNTFTEANAQLAAATLVHEDAVVALENELSELAARHASLANEHRELAAKAADLSKPPDVRRIRRELRDLKKELEVESDEKANAWVDGDDDDDGKSVHDFVADFLERRKRLHVRAAKIELLTTNHM